AAGEARAPGGAVEDIARRRRQDEEARAALERRDDAQDLRVGQKIVERVLVGVKAKPADDTLDRSEEEDAELAEDDAGRVGGDAGDGKPRLSESDALEHGRKCSKNRRVRLSGCRFSVGCFPATTGGRSPPRRRATTPRRPGTTPSPAKATRSRRCTSSAP